MKSFIIRHKYNGSLLGVPNGKGSLSAVATWPTYRQAEMALRKRILTGAIKNKNNWEILPTLPFRG